MSEYGDMHVVSVSKWSVVVGLKGNPVVNCSIRSNDVESNDRRYGSSDALGTTELETTWYPCTKPSGNLREVMGCVA
jgi:hypothetical protein